LTPPFTGLSLKGFVVMLGVILNHDYTLTHLLWNVKCYFREPRTGIEG
jgi:hypothetical protein